MIGRKGKDLVSIPLPQLDSRVQVRHRAAGRRRPGRRRGRPADRAATAQAGQGQAGDTPGEHILEVDVTLDELAADPGRRARAAAIEPKGKKRDRRREGPLHEHPPHRPRVAAALQADLQRGAQAHDRDGHLRPRRPADRADARGQALSLAGRPYSSREANAVIIYMMDVSGSMTDEQKEIVRTEVVLDRHLARAASTTASRRGTSFTTRRPRKSTRTLSYHTRESGGTRI